MEKKLKIGIIGFGGQVKSAFYYSKKCPLFEVAVIADGSEETVRNHCSAHNADLDGVDILPDYQEMLSGYELDGVFIGLPSHLHAQATLDALDAGCHVLCEKPPTSNTREILEVRERVKEKGLIYQFIRQPRFSREVQELKSLVESGELGNIYYATTEWIRGRWSSKKGWRHDAAQGGGALLDLGIHAIDNLWFALGCPEPIEVSAITRCAFREYAHSDVIYDADDSVFGVIRFSNDLMIHFETSFSLNTAGRDGKVKVTAEEDGVLNAEWKRMDVYGDKGGYENGKYLKGHRNGVESVKIHERELMPPAERQTESFIRSIAGDEKPVNTIDQAVQLMQMLDAIKKSGLTGRAVSIDS